MVTIKDCISINFPKITNDRGNLSVIEQNNKFPFLIKRVFYLYNIPAKAKRGVHALKVTGEVVVALSGSFEVIVDDGFNKRSVLLDRPDLGLYIPPGIWRELQNFSHNSIVLALASEAFSQDDYIGDYQIFKKMAISEKFK